MRLKELLADPASPPIPLANAVMAVLGKGWLGWDPEVLTSELKEHTDPTGLSEIPRESLDKLLAMRLAITTNIPWIDWHPFLICCLAFNGVPFDPEVAQVVQPSHLAYGVRILRKLKPSEPFRREVRVTMAVMLAHEGIVWVPDEPLGEIAGEELEHTNKSQEETALAQDVQREYLMGDMEGELPPPLARLKAIDLYLEAKRQAESRVVGGGS